MGEVIASFDLHAEIKPDRLFPFGPLIDGGTGIDHVSRYAFAVGHAEKKTSVVVASNGDGLFGLAAPSEVENVFLLVGSKTPGLGFREQWIPCFVE